MTPGWSSRKRRWMSTPSATAPRISMLGIQPGRIPVADAATLAAYGEDPFAAILLGQDVAIEQVFDPGVFRLRLVAERPGFERGDLKPRVLQQILHLARRVFS